MIKRAVCLLGFVLLLVAAPAWAQSANPADCLDSFDSAVDYFPDKVSVEQAAGFTVEYGNAYKVVTVTQPWAGASPVSYLLVQCGAPVPDEVTADAVIEVPVPTAVSMSTTYLPHFVELGLLDALIGTDEFDFVYSPAVRERIDAGEIAEVGGGSFVDVELLLSLEPDVVFTYGIGSADYDAHPALIAAGIPTVLNGDYMETSPLGRAEWVKFTSLFFNAEAQANALFDEIETAYTDLAAQAGAEAERPSVLVNAMYGDTWYVSGGASYMAQLINDAGGDYLWADDDSTGGLALSFEAVLDRGEAADVWLNPNFWLSLADGLNEDERYAAFEAFDTRRVYNNIARVTPLGGNDALETAVLHPEQMLADLIAIFHPALLPDHEFRFYQPLQ
jgi:iron complex transport system substrate-binding protein